MSNKKLDTYNKTNAISGWYYDLQLDNRFFCASLHANTVFKANENGDGGEWIPWSDDTVPSNSKARGYLSNEVDTEITGREDIARDDEVNYQRYSKDALCKSIINEDFQTAASNVWTDHGADAIGEVFNEFKKYAPYSDKLEGALGKLSEKTKKFSKQTKSTLLGGMLGKMGEAFEGVKDFLKNNPGVTDYLNSTLVVQGARFKYYSGTGTAFGNLGMRFTLFPKWQKIDPGQPPKFMSVTDQLEFLYPYFIGKYQKINLDSIGETKSENGLIKKVASTAEKVAKDIKMDEFVAWQHPPGGFRAKVRDIDIIQKGTLRLRFGLQYYLDNLLCSDVSLNFSKQMMKYYDQGKIKLTPLYCDVNITLTPATKYSDIKLKEFTSGDTGAVQKMENTVNSRVDEIHASLKGTYAGEN